MAGALSWLIGHVTECWQRSSRARRRRRVVALVATLCAMCVTTPQTVARAAQISPTVEYLSFIQAFSEGSAESSLAPLSDKDDRWVQTAVDGVRRQAVRWPTQTTEAAVLLHTTLVVSGWVLPTHASVHLAAARRLIAAPREAPVTDTFRCRWLLLLAWHYQEDMALGDALPWLDELRQRCAADGEAQLALGIFYESLAWATKPPEDLPWSGRSRMLAPLKRRSAREALAVAVPAFDRALRSEATRVAATVRLGRVLAALGQYDGARARLTPMLEGNVERRWRYLAALFLAETEARAGDRRAAESAYRRAADTMPGCQTPLVGVAALHQLAGDGAAAADTALQLATSNTLCDDPWWFYRFGQPPDRIPALLGELRKALIR